MNLKPGQRVTVRFNPHHSDARGIEGTIVALQPGEGFGGCDLAVVRYWHPRTGRTHSVPIALAFLEGAPPHPETATASP